MASDHKITLKVATPAGVYEGVFDVALSVGEAIVEIVKAKRLADGDAFELVFEGKVLDPGLKLSSLGLEDGTILELIASGSAV